MKSTANGKLLKIESLEGKSSNDHVIVFTEKLKQLPVETFKLTTYFTGCIVYCWNCNFLSFYSDSQSKNSGVK